MMISVLTFTVVGSYIASLLPAATMGSFSVFMTFLLGIKFIVRPVMTTKEAMQGVSAKKRAIQSVVCGIMIGLICGFVGAVLRGLMFDIALSFVLSGDDDGQTVFLAKPVRSAADIVITPLVGMIVFMIRKADRIENQVIMNMIFVYVGAKDKLILAAQDFFCKLHADLMGLLRRDLPRLKSLDQVAAQVCSLVNGMAAGPGKFDIRSFGGAAIGGYKQLSVRLFRVADIVNGCFQR